MPPSSGSGAGNPVLSAERDHLLRSREFLRLMRENVLSLRALGGDPVSEEYLKADLHRRAEALTDLPGTPLFFGRLDYADSAEQFHIGRRHVHDPDGRPAVIDWRAPVSRPFYRASPAEPLGLARRRRFGFSGGELTAYEDEDLTAGPASTAGPAASRILIEEIERPRSGPMRDIVATIQPDQDDIVRAGPDASLCVQGAPGTGKTAVGLHRIAYLLYAHPERMTRGGVLVIGPNRAFLGYIRNVLPALGELDVTQQSVADLFAAVPVRAAAPRPSARPP
jgi:DNA helicase IV